MVKSGAKKKSEKKNSKNNSTKNLKSSKISPPAHQSARITRSKSLQTVELKKNPIHAVNINTRSTSKARSLPNNCIHTRSKSEKIGIIATNIDSNEKKPANSDNKSKTQSKSLSVSKTQFVKLHDFKVNSIVLAKQKYSVPWPSRVLTIEKNRVLVHFFGDKRSGFVPKNEIYDFVLSLSALKSTIASKRNPRTYKLGITEVEMLMGITRENSLLN